MPQYGKNGFWVVRGSRGTALLILREVMNLSGYNADTEIFNKNVLVNDLSAALEAVTNYKGAYQGSNLSEAYKESFRLRVANSIYERIESAQNIYATRTKSETKSSPEKNFQRFGVGYRGSESEPEKIAFPEHSMTQNLFETDIMRALESFPDLKLVSKPQQSQSFCVIL